MTVLYGQLGLFLIYALVGKVRADDPSSVVSTCTSSNFEEYHAYQKLTSGDDDCNGFILPNRRKTLSLHPCCSCERDLSMVSNQVIFKTSESKIYFSFMTSFWGLTDESCSTLSFNITQDMSLEFGEEKLKPFARIHSQNDVRTISSEIAMSSEPSYEILLVLDGVVGKGSLRYREVNKDEWLTLSTDLNDIVIPDIATDVVLRLRNAEIGDIRFYDVNTCFKVKVDRAPSLQGTEIAPPTLLPFNHKPWI